MIKNKMSKNIEYIFLLLFLLFLFIIFLYLCYSYIYQYVDIIYIIMPSHDSFFGFVHGFKINRNNIVMGLGT